MRLIRYLFFASGLLMPLISFAQLPSTTKPIRIIVGTPPGGVNDTVARFIAQRMDSFGQVIVENRPGASQMIAAEFVAKSTPDGTTLLIASQTILAVVPNITRVTSFNPLKDFAAVALVGRTPMVLVVNPDIKIKSVKELIATAKAAPGDLNFGSGGIGTTPHMAGELFALMSGIKITNISYKGEQPALVDILGGQLPMMFSNVSAAMPFVKSGRLRALGITSSSRFDTAPGIPTIAESGLPGYEAETWLGFVVPVATPREIISRLHAEITRVMNLPDVKEKLIAQGFILERSSPEQFSEYIRSEQLKWGKVIHDAGIRSD